MRPSVFSICFVAYEKLINLNDRPKPQLGGSIEKCVAQNKAQIND